MWYLVPWNAAKELCKVMLDWYVLGECMISIHNINNDIKEPTLEYQNLNTSKLLIFGQ